MTIILSNLFVFLFLFIPMFQGNTLEQCILNIANSHLMYENNLVASSSIKNGHQPHEDDHIKDIWQSLLKELFTSQHWRLKVYSKYQYNKTIHYYDPERYHDAYIVLSAKMRSEDIVVDLNEQFSVLKQDKAWNPRAKFVISLHCKQEDENRRKVLVETIFSQLWKHFIINIIILIEEKSSYPTDNYIVNNIYTWFPYHPPGSCANTYEPILLDSCITGGGYTYFKTNTTLFPNKLIKNHGGCKLRVSTFELAPVNFKEVLYGDGSHTYLEGVEVRLLEIIGKGVNMSILYMPRSDDYFWGVQFENGTWTGITGEVMRKYSDINVTLMWYKRHLLPEFECLTPHSIDHVVWYVPCAKPYPRWSSLTRVFKPSLWLGMLCSFCNSFIYNEQGRCLQHQIFRSRTRKLLISRES